MAAKAIASTEDQGPEPDHSDGDELPLGTVLFRGAYKITDHVGSGGFGITYLAKDSFNRNVILKECFASEFCRRQQTRVTARTRHSRESMGKLVQHFLKEAQSLSELDHPNIVGVHQVFEENETAYMALEYLPGRDLLDIIDDPTTTLHPSYILGIAVRLVAAVQYIHAAGLLHGDISPDNILLNEIGEPVLIDFGAARKIVRDASSPESGFTVVKDGYSPHCLYAPNGSCGKWSDIYSLGATLYHAISKTVPVSSQSRLLAVAESSADPCKKLTGRFEGYPPGFLESIDRAMNVLPATRFQTADEWLELLDGMLGHKDLDMKLFGKSIRVGGPKRSDAATAVSTPVAAGDVPRPKKTQISKPTLKGLKMAVDLTGLKEISGFIAGCLVDTDGGLVMASETVGKFDIETAAAANVEVVRAKNNAMRLLGIDDQIEDILISLGTQLHLIRPLAVSPTLFIYAALDRKTANLGMARAQVKKVEQAIKI